MIQGVLSRTSICIWREKVQFCGTAKEVDFGDKCYKNYCKTTITWVFKVHIFLRKSFCFLDPLILDIKKAISLVAGWAKIISHNLLGTRGPRPEDSFRSAVLWTVKMILKMNKKRSIEEESTRKAPRAEHPTVAVAGKDPYHHCLVQQLWLHSPGQAGTGCASAALTWSCSRGQQQNSQMTSERGETNRGTSRVCLHMGAKQIGCSS